MQEIADGAAAAGSGAPAPASEGAKKFPEASAVETRGAEPGPRTGPTAGEEEVADIVAEPAAPKKAPVWKKAEAVANLLSPWNLQLETIKKDEVEFAGRKAAIDKDLKELNTEAGTFAAQVKVLNTKLKVTALMRGVKVDELAAENLAALQTLVRQNKKEGEDFVAAVPDILTLPDFQHLSQFETRAQACATASELTEEKRSPST